MQDLLLTHFCFLSWGFSLAEFGIWWSWLERQGEQKGGLWRGEQLHSGHRAEDMYRMRWSVVDMDNLKAARIQE